MSTPKLESSFSFAPSTAWRAPAAPAERWLAPVWTMLPLASRHCRIRNPVTGAVAELTADQHAVLCACEGCQTLPEHAAAVRRKLNLRSEDEATVVQWLDEFARGRLLTPVNELLQRLDGLGEIERAPFAGVVVRTCDRPALLARLLASASALEARFGAGHRYIVLDDSRVAAHRSANRQSIAAHPSLDCAYVDLAAPTAMERELRRRFADADGAIDWLLGSPAPDEATYGRPVNCALLLTAGRRLLMLDDDSLLEPRHSPCATPGLAISSASDQLFCYPDARALDAACAPLDVDPVAAHLDVLGRSIGSLVKTLAHGNPATLHLEADDAMRFAQPARAVFTQNHALGDPGSSLFPYHLLSLPAASKAKLLSDPQWARYAFQQRINWRGQPQFRLATRRPLTLTTLAGADNSIMLPPTARSHRNEDLLLGEVTQHVHRNAWFVDLPWALPHRRDPPKAWLDATASFAQEPIHFLIDHIGQRAAAIVGDDAQARLQTIAALFCDLSHASERHLTDLLIEQAADTATRTRFSIAEQLDAPSLPVEWKDMLRPWLASPALSTDPSHIRARIASTSTVRSLAANYGQALVAWPALWAAAREMDMAAKLE